MFLLIQRKISLHVITPLYYIFVWWVYMITVWLCQKQAEIFYRSWEKLQTMDACIPTSGRLASYRCYSCTIEIFLAFDTIFRVYFWDSLIVRKPLRLGCLFTTTFFMLFPVWVTGSYFSIIKMETLQNSDSPDIFIPHRTN